MFLENFKKEYQWRKFVESYKKARPGIASVSSEYPDSIAADENIWPFAIGAFFDSIEAPVLVITSTADRAEELSKELGYIVSNAEILGYPGTGSSIFYKNKTPGSDNLSRRLRAVSRLIEFQRNKKPFFIISSCSALINLIPQSKILVLRDVNLKVGCEYGRENLISGIVEKGYERVHKVYDKGEFSVKGGILDIFDITKDNPVRIDFFGDSIDKIMVYNISDQNMVGKLDEINICPNLDPWKIEDCAQGCNGSGYTDLRYDDSEDYNKKMLSLADLLKEYVGIFGIVICDPLEVYLKVKSDIDILEKSFNSIGEEDLTVKNKKLAGSYILDKDFIKKGKFELKLNLMLPASSSEGKDEFVFDEIRSQKGSSGNAAVFVQNLKKDLERGSKVVISLENEKRRRKIEEILLDNSVSYKDLKGKKGLDFRDLESKIINIFNLKLCKGYISKDISLYGELDIYEQALPGEYDEKAILPEIFEEFSPEDYVVHKNHGIGKYAGIISKQINGHKREYFLVEYTGGDRLYVPTWQADRIHKYIGDKEPRITPLDSRKWTNLKRRVRNSVHNLAIDLAKLYAERQSAGGFAFPKDSPWQKEIEDLFPFRETEDQVKAIEYVKKSMEKPKPMDVLVCGDVGFGKTEVAIRAAFKSIENGKQVLMLAPTTILAGQHYRNFGQRYKDYPVIVKVLSRFVAKREQKRIVEDFKDGKIDMLIGTHRILQNDIEPKDLGLIIVDEEQRFGVNSKEKLKLLKKEVDAITLTATPIPRTLYLSMTGLRETVIIKTHPEGRYPIKTYVGKKDDLIIKTAIERELARGGQVYYVYNRVAGIENERQRLQALVPDAKIALTHGQMEGRAIERIMEGFINKKYDILLTTSIIESGMDIGSVNTLIVIDSHKFGLSQLYQLRGRVGRSSEKAYAYLFYPGKEDLSINAFSRLKTLTEHTELGSGHRIAMRDLEIRGAGELLGPRQHGHIDSIGFDMYCQIMKEEIEKLKGNAVEEDINIQIELPVSAYIPKNYIRNEKDRINIYKILGNANNLEDINKICEDIKERYGKVPFVVDNLVYIAKIKYMLKKAKIEKLIFAKGKGITIKKINMSKENAVKINKRNKNLIYKPNCREIFIKMNENINLSVVLKYINVIIDFI